MTRLRAVLGIDAAWTATQPSGVALVIETPTGWELKALEASYQHFHVLLDQQIARDARPMGSLLNSEGLLATARTLAERPIDIIAVDIPLAVSKIERRRASDDCVSRVYGARHCSTHSPNSKRPGEISDRLRESFTELGYPLRTTSFATPG